MKRHKYIIVTTVLLLILIVFGVGFYLYSNQGGGGSVQNAMRNFFPREVPAKNIPIENTSTSTDLSKEETSFVGKSDNKDTKPLTLRKVSSAPVAGVVVTKKDKDTVIRYIERGTGHIFDASPLSSNVSRVTNTTIPRVQEAIWTADGLHVALRYLGDDLETIETFLANVVVGKNGTEGELRGTFLPENITTMAVNRDGTEFAYVEKQKRSYRGVRITVTGAQISPLFTSPIGEWGISYQKDGGIDLLSKPSALALGFLYSISKKTGVFNLVLGNNLGLTVKESTDDSYILFSTSAKGTITLHLLDKNKKIEEDISPTTFPEKCVWSVLNKTVLYCLVPNKIPSGQYPDVWYQGLVSFSDTIWKINTKTGSSHKLMDLEEVSREAIDGINPILSEDETFIVFTNKRDSSLWSLTLPQEEKTESSQTTN